MASPGQYLCITHYTAVCKRMFFFLKWGICFVQFGNTLIAPELHQTRQSKHCGFSIYIFDNSKSIMKKIKINGQVGQGEEDGLVWSGLC